MMAENTG